MQETEFLAVCDELDAQALAVAAWTTLPVPTLDDYTVALRTLHAREASPVPAGHSPVPPVARPVPIATSAPAVQQPPTVPARAVRLSVPMPMTWHTQPVQKPRPLRGFDALHPPKHITDPVHYGADDKVKP